MFGIALAYFLFPAFNDPDSQNAWLNVYWLLAAISALSFLFLFFADFDEGHEIPGADIADDFYQMFKLLSKMLVLVFVISAFLFVMMEQGIMTWLPTFNERVLDLPENLGIMMASIFAISLGIGRLVAGKLAERFHWVWILSTCIVIAMLIVLFVLPRAINSTVADITKLSDIPFIGYTFPLIGLVIGPIYPMLNSVVLSALPKKLHSPMTGLIVVFSALGGTLGSRFIGWLFKNVGADSAFTYTLIPMVLLLIALFILNRMTKSS